MAPLRRPRGPTVVFFLGCGLATGVASLGQAHDTTAAKRPDLAVVRVSSPPQRVVSGAAFKARVRVANRGRARAGRSRVRFRLSTGHRPEPARRALRGSAVVPPLPAGRSSLRSATLVVPAGVAPGRYRLVACVQADRLRDRRRSNDCRAARGKLSFGSGDDLPQGTTGDVSESPDLPADAVDAPDEPPGPFELLEVATGLDAPTAVDWAPDGRMLVAEKAGRVRVVEPGGRLLERPLIDISNHVNSSYQRGLLGIAVDPHFHENRFLYLLYVYEHDPLDPQGAKSSRLTRVVVTEDGAVENPDDPETVLLGAHTGSCPPAAEELDCIPADGPYHAITTVRADPDGTLWVGSGDGTDNAPALEDGQLRAYDENSLAGKIIHVDGSGNGLPDHPFCPEVTDLSAPCTKVYAKGFRNPWRFTLRADGGPVVGDVGRDDREEIDLVEAGGNYGWPCYEGELRTPAFALDPRCAAVYATEGTALAPLPPAFAYRPEIGRTVVAGPVYTGSSYPDEYLGSLTFTDYGSGELHRMRIDRTTLANPVPFGVRTPRAVDLAQGPDGDLYFVDFAHGEAGQGVVWRITYSP